MRALAISLVSLTACSTAPSDNGLALDTADADHVAGTFTRDGVSLGFDFARADDRHDMAFVDADGAPLISTTLDGVYQTTRVFGDRFVAEGITNAPNPTMTGDRAAVGELHARPEAALLDELRDGLVAAGVDLDLLQPAPPEVQNLSNYDGRYFAFNPGDQMDWLSAAGAWPTYVYVKNPWPANNGACAAVDLVQWGSPWPANDTIVADGYHSTYHTEYWWGAGFTVKNKTSDSWQTNYRHCYPTSVLVRVSPYNWSP